MHRDAEEIDRRTRNRSQVLDRIVERPALEQRLVDVRLRPTEQDRIAVRRGARDGGPTQRRTATAHILKYHSTEQRLDLVRQRAPDGVERTARREGDHKPDPPRRIFLRDGNARAGRQRNTARSQIQKCAARKFHDAPKRCRASAPAQL